ncbi:MAG: GNAT family N-acetyltransferase, partial [Anaerolineae bacterium]|nr:GNAT family N-acetyltransferase [Anaerolineae bacterium]
MEKDGAAQHIGLGTGLLEKAEQVAKEAGFSKLAVIAAIGTREYYANRGFEIGEMYMVKDI